MADADYTQVRIPIRMAKAIDDFLKRPEAQMSGVTSRSDLVVRVMAGWFSQYEKRFGAFMPRDAVRNTDDRDLPKPFD